MMGWFLAIVAVFLGYPLLLLGWLLVRTLRKPRDRHAVCGHCQYIVEGLPTMFCPECGSDFRKVGIKPPWKSGRVTPATFLALWTALLLPVALLASGAAISLGPEKVTAWTSFGLSPTSGSFGGVTITTRYVHTIFGGSVPPRLSGGVSRTAENQCTISLPGLESNGPPKSIDLDVSTAPGAKLSVYPESGGYRYTLASGQLVDESEGFGPTVVAQWLAASGLDPNSPDLRADAGDLFGLVTAYAQGQTTFTTNRYSLFAGGGSGTSLSRFGWFVAVVVSFWLLVYLGGIVLYRRIRLRQALAEAVANA